VGVEKKSEIWRLFVDLKDIKSVIELMTKNGLTEFEFEEKDGSKIRLARGANSISGENVFIPQMMPQQVVTGNPVLHSAPSSTAPQNVQAPSAGGNDGSQSISSPMVGTLYLQPAPDAPAYVKIGTEVNPDTVVCIIEAMKVMNEIKAEVRGVITEIVGQSGKPVEFGSPIFKIRPL
jgi:acetyl-CoA carboxylase biotin carboxyl carrier protein